MYLDHIIQDANKISGQSIWQYNPCTSNEIARLENNLQMQLPEAYKEFLAWIGKGSKIFLYWTIWSYKSLLNLQTYAKELLEENNMLQHFPSSGFIFLMDQGYEFYFLDIKEGDNPPIYHYRECSSSFETEFCSFSEFVEFNIKAHFSHKQGASNSDIIALKQTYSPCVKK